MFPKMIGAYCRGCPDKPVTYYRGGKAHDAWRKAVWDRDGGTCVLCAAPGEHVDHIQPWSIVRGTALEFDVTNGRVLCVGCHIDAPTTPVAMRALFEKSRAS